MHSPAQAVKAGTIPATPFGTMSYRLYGKKDRIQLLWVLSVPGATPESIGVSEGSQRAAAIAGDGRPWLMLYGTPGAHIVIPINWWLGPLTPSPVVTMHRLGHHPARALVRRSPVQ
jgi:hypothetical protein